MTQLIRENRAQLNGSNWSTERELRVLRLSESLW